MWCHKLFNIEKIFTQFILWEKKVNIFEIRLNQSSEGLFS